MKMRSMAVLSKILAPYVVLVCLANACLGHSTQNQRLGRIDSVAQPTIQLVHSTFKSFAKRSTLSHFSQLAHDDAFVLEFDAFGRSFAVYLQPNLDLLHPAATTTVFDDETGTSVTTPLRHADHRLYKGQVLSSIDHFLLANHLFSDHDLNQWARITIRHDIE
ncbi:hypothetical protein BC940DRAFT_95026 [Gongronella butleri]|nr:hypothetical protein BC940DRAFT_95026 [Gongronella butleri]